MIRVIGKKAYDTDDAEQIARHAPNTDRRRYNYLIETLYQDADGEYFLHGEGGAASKYAKPSGDGTTSGEEIQPMTDEEAMQWCEDQNIDGEVVIEHFSHLIENV